MQHLAQPIHLVLTSDFVIVGIAGLFEHGVRQLVDHDLVHP
ncbi:hypothetical protein B4100_3857 [Heyndrickxia coagulans]|nr:hypothetical protein B4100_3857 [Heyndrickxia coagulans]